MYNLGDSGDRIVKPRSRIYGSFTNNREKVAFSKIAEKKSGILQKKN